MALRASVVTSVAGKAAEMVTLVLLATVVPRAMGPSEYGRFAVPLALVTIGSLALTLGGQTVMARYVPAAGPAERVALARAIGRRLARGRALQLTFLASAAGVLAAWMPDRFPPLETVLVVSALGVNVAATLVLQVGLGLGRTGPWSARFPLQNGVLVVLVLLLHPAMGFAGALVSILASAAVAAGFAIVTVRPVAWLDRPTPAEVPTGAMRFGVLQAAGAALVQATHRGGVLAVALLGGSSAETGYAALAVGMAVGATYAIVQVFTVALPHLSGDGADRPDAAESVLRRLAGAVLVLAVPSAALAAVLAGAVVPAVVGTRYQGSVAAMGPALAQVALAPLAALGVQVAALRFRPEAALVSGGASLAVFAAVALLAIPGWGAAGGTAACLAGAAAGSLVWLRLLPGAFGVRLVSASFGGAAAVLALGSLAP